MPINIKFIARQAGVSISTVSRVMNGNCKVNDEMRKRVLSVVEKYHYEPNSIARSLVCNRTNLIGVVVPNVSDEFHTQMLIGIEKKAAALGFDVLVVNIYQDFQRENRCIDTLLGRHVDGILLLHENTAEEMRTIRERVHVPLVLTGVKSNDLLPFIGIDNQKAAFDATSFLIKNGHRHIGFVCGAGESAGRLRLDGYLDALRENGMPQDESYIAQGDYSYLSGYQATQKLMLEKPDLTAIFLASDEMAVGAINAIHDAGKDVPGTISVMGFDDIRLASFVRPTLTTVRQPIEEIGRGAAALLVSLIQQEDNQQGIILNHSIIQRDSVKSI